MTVSFGLVNAAMVSMLVEAWRESFPVHGSGVADPEFFEEPIHGVSRRV